MKILFLCVGMAFEVNEKTSRNATGYSYLVRDLASEMIKKNNVAIDCYSKNKEPEKDSWRGINLVKRTFLRILRYARPYYLIKGIEFARLIDGAGFWKTLYLIFTFLEGGLVEAIIKEGKYDLVSIQGFTEHSIPYILACQRTGCRYCVSFHALNIFHKNLYTNQERVTKWALDQLAKDRVPVSFISSRMRDRALRVIEPQNKEKANFITILNGCTSIPEVPGDVRKILNIPDSANLGICCGNITELKNQVQVVRAYNLLDPKLKKDLYFIFVGNINDMNIRAEIEKSDHPSHLILCGPIDHEQLFPYYNASDFVCIPSISEGFGLSAIEGFSLGKPVLMWSDLDAVEDIYDENAMNLVKERDDVSFSKGIEKMIQINWDSKYIEDISKKYSISRMTSDYLRWFEEQLA